MKTYKYIETAQIAMYNRRIEAMQVFHALRNVDADLTVQFVGKSLVGMMQFLTQHSYKSQKKENETEPK
jgi:hypothetical protein